MFHIKRKRKVSLKNKQVLDALRESAGVITTAAAKMGVTRQAISRRVNRSQTLRTACDEIIEENIDHAESQLQRAIRNGNLTAIIFYLKTFGRRRGYSQQEVVREKMDPITVAAEINEALQAMERATCGDPTVYER
jgi:hypothetical protein